METQPYYVGLSGGIQHHKTREHHDCRKVRGCSFSHKTIRCRKETFNDVDTNGFRKEICSNPTEKKRAFL